MKILNISLDKDVIDKNSAVAQRMIEYGRLVDKFTILILADENKEISLSDKVKVIAIKKSFCKIYNFLRLKKQAKNILKKEQHEVITVQDIYFLGWLAVKLVRKFKIGLEVQVHGFEKFWGIRKMLAKYVLKNADSIRAVSQRLRQKMVQEFGVAEEKITVAPIYVDIAKSTGLPLRQLADRNDSKFIFLTVGRLVPVKNIKMQIDAMKNIVAKNSNVELWIVGDGELSQKLKVQSQKSDVGDKIKFLGWQDDIEKYYSQADAFLLTSNSEGWGMAVVEAAQFGLPIIITDVGLAGEVIKDSEGGIVIPVEDQEELEKAMIKIIEDKNLREKLGNGACEAIKKLPTKEETLELYKQSWTKALKR